MLTEWEKSTAISEEKKREDLIKGVSYKITKKPQNKKNHKTHQPNKNKTPKEQTNKQKTTQKNSGGGSALHEDSFYFPSEKKIFLTC